MIATRQAEYDLVENQSLRLLMSDYWFNNDNNWTRWEIVSDHRRVSLRIRFDFEHHKKGLKRKGESNEWAQRPPGALSEIRHQLDDSEAFRAAHKVSGSVEQSRVNQCTKSASSSAKMYPSTHDLILPKPEAFSSCNAIPRSIYWWISTTQFCPLWWFSFRCPIKSRGKCLMQWKIIQMRFFASESDFLCGLS